MKIFIKPTIGQHFSIEIEADDKVLKLKEAIERSKGLPYNFQRLIYRGKFAIDDMSLRDDLNVKAGSEMYLDTRFLRRILRDKEL